MQVSSMLFTGTGTFGMTEQLVNGG